MHGQFCTPIKLSLCLYKQEVPRSSDYAISRTFHLFSVELHTVARVVLQRCYKVSNSHMIIT